MTSLPVVSYRLRLIEIIVTAILRDLSLLSQDVGLVVILRLIMVNDKVVGFIDIFMVIGVPLIKLRVRADFTYHI